MFSWPELQSDINTIQRLRNVKRIVPQPLPEEAPIQVDPVGQEEKAAFCLSAIAREHTARAVEDTPRLRVFIEQDDAAHAATEPEVMKKTRLGYMSPPGYASDNDE